MAASPIAPADSQRNGHVRGHQQDAYDRRLPSEMVVPDSSAVTVPVWNKIRPMISEMSSDQQALPPAAETRRSPRTSTLSSLVLPGGYGQQAA